EAIPQLRGGGRAQLAERALERRAELREDPPSRVPLGVDRLRGALSREMREQGAYRRARELPFELADRWYLPARLGEPLGELLTGIGRTGVERGAPTGEARDARGDLERTSRPRAKVQDGIDDGGRRRRPHRCPEGLQRHPWIERMLLVVTPDHVHQPRCFRRHRVLLDHATAQR